MSLSQLMSEHVTSVFMNTDHFAETVIRYAGGDVGNISTFTGIVTLHPAQVDDGRGRGVMQSADLVLSSSVTIAEGDAISHGGLRYEVKAVGDPEEGMRTVSLVRYLPIVKGAKPLRNGDL